jgi:hypothetical protein
MMARQVTRDSALDNPLDYEPQHMFSGVSLVAAHW